MADDIGQGRHPNPKFRLVSPEENIDVKRIESTLWFHANKRRIEDVGDAQLYGVRFDDPIRFNLTSIPRSVKLPWLAFTVQGGALQTGGLTQ